MHGSIDLPFSQLFEDTIREHGSEWAHKHYTRNGMSDTEFFLWIAIVGVA